MKRNHSFVATLLLSLGMTGCAHDLAVALPEPTGAYAVGVTTATLVDERRVERFDRHDGPRRLTVTAWYPAAPAADDVPATMLLDLDASHVRRALRGMGLPGELADVMAATETSAWRDAPRSRAREQWPVLLLSHGFMSAPEFYTGLATELASHGYVVVGINHPYESSAAVFSDGEAIEGKMARFIFRIVPQMRGIDRLSGMAAGAEKAEKTDAMLAKNTLLGESLAVWVEDSSFVLDRLERLDDDQDGTLVPLAGGLDLEHVGALGHSFGGATAVALTLADPRIDAAINWDGFQFGAVRAQDVPVPTLLIESAQLPGVNEMIFAASSNHTTLTLPSVLHLGMSDLAYVEGLRERKAEKVLGNGEVGVDMSAAIARSLEHMHAWVGAPAGLLDSPAVTASDEARAR